MPEHAYLSTASHRSRVGLGASAAIDAGRATSTSASTGSSESCRRPPQGQRAPDGKHPETAERRYKARHRDEHEEGARPALREGGQSRAGMARIGHAVRQVRGDYVDPQAGKAHVRRFSRRNGSPHRPSTNRLVKRSKADCGYTYCRPSRRRSSAPSSPRACRHGSGGRQERWAPTYVRVMLVNLSGILGAAVEDGLIARNRASHGTRCERHGSSRTRSCPGRPIVFVAVVAAHPERWPCRSWPPTAGSVRVRCLSSLQIRGRRLALTPRARSSPGQAPAGRANARARRRGGARGRDQYPRPHGVPRAHRSRLHTADLHVPDADVGGPRAAGDGHQMS